MDPSLWCPQGAQTDVTHNQFITMVLSSLEEMQSQERGFQAAQPHPRASGKLSLQSERYTEALSRFGGQRCGEEHV